MDANHNLVICTNGPFSGAEFSCLMTRWLPDLGIMRASQCFPIIYFDDDPEDANADADPAQADQLTLF